VLIQKKGSKKQEVIHADVNVVNEEEDDEAQVTPTPCRKCQIMLGSPLRSST
jgi:hypothetical protein